MVDAAGPFTFALRRLGVQVVRQSPPEIEVLFVAKRHAVKDLKSRKFLFSIPVKNFNTQALLEMFVGANVVNVCNLRRFCQIMLHEVRKYLGENFRVF